MTNFHPPWKYCLSCDLQSVRIFKLFLCLKRSKHCTFSNSIMYKASGENYKVREGTSFQNWHENKKYKEKGNLAHPNALLNYFHAKYLAFSTFLFKKVTEEQRHSFACSAPPPPFFQSVGCSLASLNMSMTFSTENYKNVTFCGHHLFLMGHSLLTSPPLF